MREVRCLAAKHRFLAAQQVSYDERTGCCRRNRKARIWSAELQSVGDGEVELRGCHQKLLVDDGAGWRGVPCELCLVPD
jgi:hypothetical protein